LGENRRALEFALDFPDGEPGMTPGSIVLITVNVGRDHPDHGRSRDSGGHGPSGGRVRNGRDCRPNSRCRTFRLHNAVPPNANPHTAACSSSLRAIDIDFLPDTNIRPPKNSPAREQPAVLAPPAEPVAVQSGFLGTLGPSQAPQSTAMLLIVFSLSLSPRCAFYNCCFIFNKLHDILQTVNHCKHSDKEMAARYFLRDGLVERMPET
jgi:hypothetical protein